MAAAITLGRDWLRRASPGLIVALAIAIAARWLADSVGHSMFGAGKTPVSPVLCAVLFGAIWRSTFGVATRLEPGLAWATTALLRTGIALVGMRLTLTTVGQVGLFAIPVVVVCIGSALLLARVLTKPLQLTSVLSRLLAVGAAVCGCTAVMAVAPVIGARKDEMGYAVACVVLFGLLAMLGYPYLAHALFGATPSAAGIFLGTAIHDTSQVIGAGLIYSQQFDSPAALAAATTAKLLRNLSMVVLIPWFAWAAPRDTSANERTLESASAAGLIPMFIWFFIGFVILRTVGDSAVLATDWTSQWNQLMSAAGLTSEFLLTAGMAAVGLGITFSGFRGIGWRPLLAAMLIAVTVGVVSLGMTTWVSRWM